MPSTPGRLVSTLQHGGDVARPHPSLLVFHQLGQMIHLVPHRIQFELRKRCLGAEAAAPEPWIGQILQPTAMFPGGITGGGIP